MSAMLMLLHSEGIWNEGTWVKPTPRKQMWPVKNLWRGRKKLI